MGDCNDNVLLLKRRIEKAPHTQSHELGLGNKIKLTVTYFLLKTFFDISNEVYLRI